MKIISRYVMSELLQVFLVALTALTLFMLVVGLVKEAQQQGLGMMQIAALVPYVLPEAMRFAVPGTMLFAVASVFGRLSASNEITALKAAGITPMAAIWPAIGLAIVVSFVSVWLNDIAVSWGRDGVRRVIVSSVEDIIYGRLRQQRSYSTAKLSINVKGVEGRKLLRPTLSFQPGGETAPVTVSAAEAEMRADAKTGTLTITCRNGTLHAACFGLPDAAGRQAKGAAAAWCPQVDDPVELSIASLSDPQADFSCVTRAVAAAARVTHPGGMICVVSRLATGPGLIFLRWRQGAPLEQLVHEAVATGDQTLIADALQTRLFSRALGERRFVLLSDLGEEAVEELEFGYAASPEVVERLAHRSERIVVLAEGRVTAELSRAEATEQRIMEAATGGYAPR